MEFESGLHPFKVEAIYTSLISREKQEKYISERLKPTEFNATHYLEEKTQWIGHESSKELFEI